MKTQDFINQIEKDQLVRAIQEAQKGNSGDIVLLVTQKKVADAMKEGHQAFRRLSSKKVTHPNAILIFLAPESRCLAVIGGSEIYQKLPAGWWEELAGTITRSFGQGRLTEGLLEGIATMRAALLTYFPTDRPADRTGQSDLLED